MDVKDIDVQKYQKHFSEQSFLEKIFGVGKSIGATVVYPNLLLYHLYKSGSISLKQKGVVAGALGYFILPLDLIPDVFVGYGYTDDMVALTAALTALAASFTDEVQDAAKAHLKQVLGDYDDRAVEAASKIIQAANRVVTLRNPVAKDDKKNEPTDVTDIKPQ